MHVVLAWMRLRSASKSRRSLRCFAMVCRKTCNENVSSSLRFYGERHSPHEPPPITPGPFISYRRATDARTFRRLLCAPYLETRLNLLELRFDHRRLMLDIGGCSLLSGCPGMHLIGMKAHQTMGNIHHDEETVDSESAGKFVPERRGKREGVARGSEVLYQPVCKQRTAPYAMDALAHTKGYNIYDRPSSRQDQPLSCRRGGSPRQ